MIWDQMSDLNWIAVAVAVVDLLKFLVIRQTGHGGGNGAIAPDNSPRPNLTTIHLKLVVNSHRYHKGDTDRVS